MLSRVMDVGDDRSRSRLGSSIFGIIAYAVATTVVKHFADNIRDFTFNLDGALNFNWRCIAYQKHVVSFEGKTTQSTSTYYGHPITSSSFTNNFRALWQDIITKASVNPEIYEIKEMTSECDKNNKKSNIDDIFVVSQKRHFLYNEDLQIYASAEFKSENSGDEKGGSTQTERIIIRLYSFASNTTAIKKHVESLTKDYLKTITSARGHQKFIYTLYSTKYEDSHYECWDEFPFTCSRTFENIFFDGQEEVIKKVNFFLDNKAWYDEMGIPYTLGIGLHGPPGTGKTSFIKCLANLTERHIVVISLKYIKTKQQLHEYFFEDTYNGDNKKHSINFENKIVVLEEIDCMGAIVLKRSDQRIPTPPTHENGLGDIIANLIDTSAVTKLSAPTPEEPVTLDDILTLFDGIRETPGRIMAMTSNRYDELDDALTRPGRVDICLKLDYATKGVIKSMYEKYYGVPMKKEEFTKVRDRQFTPAQIVNFYTTHRYDPTTFLLCVC